MSIYEILEGGIIVAADEELGFLIAANGAYLNLYVESPRGWDAVDCRHRGDHDVASFYVVTAANVVDAAESWLEEIRAEGEE